MEWLYHIGVPEDQIEELAEHSANTIPVMMPYIDAFFMPRAMGDRPDIVPEGAVNFAFLGQFAETGRDTIFTTEYSMRTGTSTAACPRSGAACMMCVTCSTQLSSCATARRSPTWICRSSRALP